MQADLSLEVRKAYRLLFDYQDRILNLMQYIETTYGIRHKKGKPLFSSRGSNRLDNWAWDWLYMYCYQFYYEHFNNETNELIWLSVIIMNDTGYYEANSENKISELDVAKFKAVEDATTKIIFTASTVRKDYPIEEEATKSNKGVSEDKKLVYKCYPLEKFFTETSTLKQLQDFSKYCKQYQIPINIIKKIIN